MGPSRSLTASFPTPEKVPKPNRKPDRLPLPSFFRGFYSLLNFGGVYVNCSRKFSEHGICTDMKSWEFTNWMRCFFYGPMKKLSVAAVSPKCLYLSEPLPKVLKDKTPRLQGID